MKKRPAETVYIGADELIDVDSLRPPRRSDSIDAARYRFLRAHWGELICTTYLTANKNVLLDRVELSSSTARIDPRSVDTAIDIARGAI